MAELRKKLEEDHSLNVAKVLEIMNLPKHFYGNYMTRERALKAKGVPSEATPKDPEIPNEPRKRARATPQMITIPLQEKKDVKILIGNPDDIQAILGKLGY